MRFQLIRLARLASVKHPKQLLTEPLWAVFVCTKCAASAVALDNTKAGMHGCGASIVKYAGPMTYHRARVLSDGNKVLGTLPPHGIPNRDEIAKQVRMWLDANATS